MARMRGAVETPIVARERGVVDSSDPSSSSSDGDGSGDDSDSERDTLARVLSKQDLDLWATS